MSSSVFQIKEHEVECQHIREYPRALSHSQNDVLHLAVKQYIPLDNLQPQDGDVTIVAAHANAFPKELYEPLWEDLHARSKANGFRIRSIWITDVAQQGASGVLNEQLLGDDPSWMDSVRDLLHMINVFRSEMPMPIVGIGHSFGGAMLCNLAYMHPRLFSTIVFLDPVIQAQASAPTGPSPVRASAFRRDLWPSREEAITAFKKQKFFSSWDPRAFERWCQYGIRENPSNMYPDQKGSVTLATTKHQECFTFMRPSWEGVSPDGTQILRRDLVPDLSLDFAVTYPLYRPEPPTTLARIDTLRPSALFIFGETSPMSLPESRRTKMELTGTGIGGSGGSKDGMVKEVVLKDVGHLVAMEATEQCAEASAKWLSQELKRHEAAAKEYVEWTKKTLSAKQTLSDEYKRKIGGPLVKPPKSKI
ncbi:prolyl aminopeptidase-like protein [Amylocarpus encephaloides]|uniref:Prolyl aminopeptidase-like protein n=1 Tax=Amylocarpus encephaloides TaxID=45428 RepID=A0A9P7YUI5_9HELO|nr:prolyl aminopeptidase-like protein [Amylocarpus encephaloides]